MALKRPEDLIDKISAKGGNARLDKRDHPAVPQYNLPAVSLPSVEPEDETAREIIRGLFDSTDLHDNSPEEWERLRQLLATNTGVQAISARPGDEHVEFKPL